MLSEQKQESALRPFQILINQFDSELGDALQALADWEKARSVRAAPTEIPDNNELGDKIQQLENRKKDVEKFVEELRIRLDFRDADFDKIADELRSSLADFTVMFNEAQSLLNYRYTAIQKNEINKRITVVNSSRMLSNIDMEALQKFWTSILNMRNDRRLAAAKKTFEDRLFDWESLIAAKKNSSPII
jgi:cellulose biosynthesis protein BcsQ